MSDARHEEHRKIPCCTHHALTRSPTHLSSPAHLKRKLRKEGELGVRSALLPLAAMTLTLLTAVGTLLALAISPAQGAVPNGFTQSQVASGLAGPMDMEFAPDGRLFVAEEAGKVRIVKPNGTLATFLDISSKVDIAGERGLIGVTFDPNFATNHFVYLYYTRKATATTPVHNRVVRVTASGDSAVAGSEVLVFRLNNQSAQIHQGGALDFGNDGKLYLSTGDNATPGNAQSLGNLFVKVVRINKDGTIPTSNPFYTTASGNNRAIWALGLRNPFKIAVNAGTGTIFINDVGGARWEEINRGAAGANYGWPVHEGVANATPYVDPVFAYPHDPEGILDPNATGCAIAGSTFYSPTTAQFPAEYVGDYFFADYCNGWIRNYDPTSDQANLFATGVDRAVDLEVHKDESLYVLKRTAESVERIQYTGSANRPPTADVTANPTSGPLPPEGLEVAFDGSASSDPDAGDTLTSYIWNFGDGTAPRETTTPTTTHTYSTKGTYTASLPVKDNHGALSEADTVRIDAGNQAPTPVIDSPSAGLLFWVGEQITLSGSATDPEDGQLPEGSLRWEVLLHHNGNHTHPYFSETGNNLTITAPMPEGLDATGPGNFLEVRLTATDKKGLSKTVTREIQPNRV